MNAVTYRLRLLEPVLVSQAESGEENSAIGLSFVPGSALRGALAGSYLRCHPAADASTDETFRPLILDGSVCYLNAYPLREGKRTLPRPFSWMTEKAWIDDEEGPVYDWALDPERELQHPKAPGGDFCLLGGAETVLAKAERQINVHISLEEVNIRTDENKVYRYEALAAGEVLAGAVVSENDALLGQVRDLLMVGEITIGGAHGAGYGRVAVEAVTKPGAWQEYAPEGEPGEGKLVVTLLSDAILRGANGQGGDEVCATLAEALGLQRPATKPSAFYSMQFVGGYNRKWSLPLPQTWAARAGSVFVFDAEGCDSAAVRERVALGIGDRRAEGFGRVAVNWQCEAELQRRKAKKVAPKDVTLTPTSQALAQQMADRRLRLLLERKLVEQVNACTVKSPPKNAQLSRVRSVVQRTLAQKPGEGQKTLQPVLEHLDALKGAREQFEKARIGNTPLLSWIKDRCEKLDVQEQLLRGPVLPQVAGRTAQLLETLKLEFTARLLDGVLKKASKQNQQEVGG